MTALPPCVCCGSTGARAQLDHPNGGPTYCWDCMPPRASLIALGLIVERREVGA